MSPPVLRELPFAVGSFNSRQATLDHELHRGVHVCGNHGLPRMYRRPYSKQFVHEALAYIRYSAEIDLDSFEVRIQTIK